MTRILNSRDFATRQESLTEELTISSVKKTGARESERDGQVAVVDDPGMERGTEATVSLDKETPNMWGSKRRCRSMTAKNVLQVGRLYAASAAEFGGQCVTSENGSLPPFSSATVIPLKSVGLYQTFTPHHVSDGLL